ncbi:hypothetical protein Tco_0462099 [Tanacetum coccineum]
MGPIVITQIATGLSVLAGAALLKSVMDQNPMMGPGSGSGSGQKCLSCNGTGRVSCMCNRWSDGDMENSGRYDRLPPVQRLRSTLDTGGGGGYEKKNKDVQDDGFQSVKRNSKWESQGSEFNKYTNRSFKPVVKPKSSTPVSNLFSALEEDNDNSIDDMWLRMLSLGHELEIMSIVEF